MTKQRTQQRLSDLRFKNTDGRVIPLHHAFLTLKTPRLSVASAVTLPAIFLALLWYYLPQIVECWTQLFTFWTSKIYGAYVGTRPMTLAGQALRLPYPGLTTENPTPIMVYWNFGLCVMFFALSFLLPARITPITYLLRGGLLIQTTTSVAYFFGYKAPYNLPIYITDTLSLSIYMLFMLPIALGLVYYIFDFGFWRKALLTGVMLAYFLIAIPMQYMLHAIVIHEWSLLFLPLMYLLFGTLLEVLMFVSIYALGMSWHKNPKGWEGRGV